VFSLLTLSAALLSGCSSDSDEGGGGGGDTSSAGCNGKGETFTAGMSKLGDEGNLTFVLMSSDPAPPKRYYNTWVIQVKEGDAPVEGATVDVAPTMVGHPHPAEALTITEPSPGSYEATPLNLFMLGLWQVDITATTSAGTTDRTKFSFCIQG
jgi:hypothetical protein